MSESGDANTEEPPRPSGQAEGEPPVGVAPLEGAATAGGHHDDDNEHSKQHKKKRKVIRLMVCARRSIDQFSSVL